MRFRNLCGLMIFIVIVQLTAEAVAKDKHGRQFVRGKGATLPVEAGDTVVSSLIVSKKTSWVPVHPPYRWYYAINPDHFLFFTYAGGLFSKTIPKIIERKTGKYAKINFVNHRKKQKHVGPVGSLVAILMAGKALPFNLFFCNSKHYVEYLSRGYANGKLRKLLFNTTSKNCPVFATLSDDPGFAFTIYHNRRFELMDKKKKTILLTISSWPAGILPSPPTIGNSWDRQTSNGYLGTYGP